MARFRLGHFLAVGALCSGTALGQTPAPMITISQAHAIVEQEAGLISKYYVFTAKRTAIVAAILTKEKAGGYDSPGELIKYSFDKNGKPQRINYAGTSLMSWEEAQKNNWF